MNRKLVLSEVNEAGVLFQVIPLIGLTMLEGMITEELQEAHMKLDEAMEDWDKNWVKQ